MRVEVHELVLVLTTKMLESAEYSKTSKPTFPMFRFVK